MTDHANELRRYSRKIGRPAGDVPSVMLAAADEIERLAARLEAAEKERDELRVELNEIRYWTAVAHDTIKALNARIEAAENDAAHQKALADSALRVANGWERKCDALRAKIEQMEKQVPICRAEDLRHAEILLPSLGLMPEDKLYALPGAQTQPAPGIPEGWKLVPIEPTEKMINEGTCASTLPGPRYIDSACAKQCWTNMLAAAPEANQ